MPSYLDRLPDSLRKPGDHSGGEIELLPPGEDPAFGILYEDPYILLVRDRVRFPNGNEGGYLRIINTAELTGSPGTVIIPIWKDEIVFIRIFRHATRTWEWELPRGFQEPGISEQANAEKEIFEELGVKAASVKRIGGFNANTGLLTGEIGVYTVELAADPTSAGKPETDEGIIHFRAVPKEQLRTFLRDEKVRCGISLAALYLYQLDR